MPSGTITHRIISCLITKACISLFALGGDAAEINGATVLRGDAIEGGLVMARTAAGSVVTLDDAVIPATVDGLFIIGFHRDSDQPVTIKIIQRDGKSQRTVLTPEQRDYDIQRIDGLQKDMVTPPESVIARIKSDQAAVATARQKKAMIGDFWQGLDWPVKGQISGVFGSQRILNGNPRQPHWHPSSSPGKRSGDASEEFIFFWLDCNHQSWAWSKFVLFAFGSCRSQCRRQRVAR